MTPQILYKYKPINEYLFEMLINNEFYFANPNEINDPFDSKLHLDMQGTKEEWLKWAESLSNDFKIGTFDKNDVIQRLSKIKLDNITIRELYPDAVVDLVLSNKITDSMKIFSLSSKDDNILMWSHYANQHKGVCLGFKVSPINDMLHIKMDEKISPYETQFDQPIWKVNYSLDMPIQYNPLIHHGDNLVKFLITKHQNWYYEQEYRAILLENSWKQKKKFHKGTLSSIIFGMKSDTNQRKTIRKLVNELYIDKGFDVKFYFAVDVIGKYAVQIIDYKYAIELED